MHPQACRASIYFLCLIQSETTMVGFKYILYYITVSFTSGFAVSACHTSIDLYEAITAC